MSETGAKRNCFFGVERKPGPDDKKATNLGSLPWRFSELFRPVFEWVVAQAFHDSWTVRSCRIHLIAFPAAERHHANPQPASRFRLEYLQLEASFPEVAANGGWCFRNGNAAVVRWEVSATLHVHRPFIKRQHRARPMAERRTNLEGSRAGLHLREPRVL
jgi:hypothetical protein